MSSSTCFSTTTYKTHNILYMYEAQRCILFYSHLYYSIDKCTRQWHCGNTPKDELPYPRGSLANNIATFLCYRASQSRCSTRQLPFRHSMYQTHCNFCIFKLFKFCVYLILYTRSFTKLNLFENLLYRYIKFITTKVSRSTVYCYLRYHSIQYRYAR